MKARFKICFLVILLFSMAVARGNSIHIFNPYYKSTTRSINPGSTGSVLTSFGRQKNIDAASLDSITRLLRLKLYVDQYNYDDIVIGFNQGASSVYDYNTDSKYMQGLNAAEGLASYSSDGVPLSINLLPLPQQQVSIRLDVEAENSGQVTLEKTQLDQLPANYTVWLVDRYLKDSLDLTANSTYIFNINKADTASFGSYRFCVVVRQSQTPVPPFQLVDFEATKSGSDAQLVWDTKNEANTTTFAVERSGNGGTTFTVLDTLISTAAGTYRYSDKNPPVASDEYRLKITASNGVISYSGVVTLGFGSSLSSINRNINIYPNPASSVVNLTINPTPANVATTPILVQNSFSATSLAPNTSNVAAVYNIRIVNIFGAVIKTATSANETWQDNITSLMPGTYIITVFNNSTNKLVGRSTFVKM
jgi:hypothetical protein